MKNLLYIILSFPLLFSCQEKYNQASFDQKEEKLRKYPDTLKMLVLDSLWQKRDSLSYLRFKNLEQVYLEETDSIPKWITNFRNLQVLNTSNYHKKINKLPKDIGSLINIKQIYLPKNSINKLPVSFYNLVNIERLTLDYNNITEISQDIIKLKNLEVISLDGNLIKILPNSFCELKKLKLISLDNTTISELPPCIKSLNGLERLYISNTKISHIPLEILSLPNLKDINAKGLKLDNYKEVKEICKKHNIAFYYDE